MATEIATIYLETQRYIGIKTETTAGTPIALTTTGSTSNFRYLVEKLKITLKVGQNKRKYAVGDPYPFQNVMGSLMGEISGTMHVQGYGATGGYPAHFILFQMAGFQEVNNSLAYGVVQGLPNTTSSVWIEEKANQASSIVGKRYMFKGCGVSKLTEHWDASGGLQQIDFTITGALDDIVDLSSGGNSTPYLTADTSLPPAILGITCQFTPAAGTPYPMTTKSMTIDYAIKGVLIEDVADATGFAYWVTTDFDTIGTFKPLMNPESISGFYTAISSATPTLGTLFITLGTGIMGDALNLIANNAQITKADDLEATDGIDSTTVVFTMIRTANSADGSWPFNPYFMRYVPQA